MFCLALMLLLQAAPQEEVRPPEVQRILGPYTFRENQGSTTKVILQNGLTVIVRRDTAVPLASITTLVKAGYFDEEDRISGISHVIEHMFFKGTAQRPVGEIARETKALGGDLNAYTYYDRTVYYTVVPAENTLKALDIQADALWRSSFDAEELRREIEVVLQENNRKLDNPSAVASEKLYEAAFAEHRMRRWRIGTEQGLRALSRDDIVAYFSKYYRPSNIVLAVVGQVDIEKTLAEIVRLYGEAEPIPVERDLSPAEPPQISPRHGSMRGPIEQPYVAVGYHVPGAQSPEEPALEVLAAVLAEGRASRMNQYLRDEKGVISSGSAGLNSFVALGFLEVNAQTEKPVEAQIAILAEIESIKRDGVSNEAVARAKAFVAQNALNHLETVSGVAETLVLYEALGDWKKSDARLSQIRQVTAVDVRAVARKYLTVENLSAFEYVPNSLAPTASTAFQETVLAKVSAAVPVRAESELTETAEIPTLDSIAVAAAKPIQKRSILRGPDVYIVEDHRLPLVSFGLFYPGGRLLESESNAGITELMLRSALRGTKRFSSADIARRLENAGARISVVNEADFFGYTIEGMGGKMGPAIEILVEILQEPLFKEEEVERERALQLSRLKNLRENNYSYPLYLFLKTLFGNHPYARPSIGIESAVQKLTGKDLRAWFLQNQRKLIPTIFIVGNTQGTALVAPVTDKLTNEDLVQRDISVAPPPQLRPEPKETVESVSRRQTALVYGFSGASRASDDRYSLVVLQNIVSGLGGRFFDAIREKQGLAYTVSTSNAFFARAGAVFTYSAFSPENEEKVKAALEVEFGRLRNEGVTADEVRKAIAYSVGERDAGLQTRSSQVLEYARALFSGTGVASVSGYSDRIRQVTPSQIQDVARRYFEPGMLRIGEVRGR